MIRGRTRNPTPPRPWIPAFAGKTVEPRRARASGYPEGGGGVSGPLTRPRDGFLLSQEWLRSGAGRGPAPIDHPCESRGLPPHTTRRPVFTTRPGPGFLLSQEWLRSGAGRGPAPIDHPCESRSLPPHTMRRPVFTTAPALDSCFRRNGCGQGRDAAPRPLTTPAKAGVYRLILCGAPYSPPPRPWIPAFAGMVAVRGGTRPRAH